MPTEKRPLKVFLCHAHADRDAVRALYSHLTKDGVDAWLDKEKLLPGHDWELEIRKAVREVDVVVVCLSKQFNQAGFRQKEVRLALDTAMEQPEGEIFIIPARLEECDTLESLRKWHWVDLFEDDGYEKLMLALRTRSEKIGVTFRVKKNKSPKISISPLGSAKSIIKKKDDNISIDQWLDTNKDGVKVGVMHPHDNDVVHDNVISAAGRIVGLQSPDNHYIVAYVFLDIEYEHMASDINQNGLWEIKKIGLGAMTNHIYFRIFTNSNSLVAKSKEMIVFCRNKPGS